MSRVERQRVAINVEAASQYFPVAEKIAVLVLVRYILQKIWKKKNTTAKGASVWIATANSAISTSARNAIELVILATGFKMDDTKLKASKDYALTREKSAIERVSYATFDCAALAILMDALSSALNAITLFAVNAMVVAFGSSATYAVQIANLRIRQSGASIAHTLVALSIRCWVYRRQDHN